MRFAVGAMPYSLSATKLQNYHRCPQAYYFRYERGMSGPVSFGSASLGTALHQALATIYRDWHYQNPLPQLEWLELCWHQHNAKLNPAQQAEGWEILCNYCQRFISTLSSLKRPLAVEGKLQGSLEVENVEFVLTGRYDRLDWLDDGVELIDYKSAKQVSLPEPAEVDLQLGLYYLALEQVYQQSLRKLSFIYLRTGEQISFDVTPELKRQLEDTIGELALSLRADAEWEPAPGEQCDGEASPKENRCGYKRYCPAMEDKPEPLPETAKPASQVQLVLSL